MAQKTECLDIVTLVHNQKMYQDQESIVEAVNDYYTNIGPVLSNQLGEAAYFYSPPLF